MTFALYHVQIAIDFDMLVFWRLSLH